MKRVKDVKDDRSSDFTVKRVKHVKDDRSLDFTVTRVKHDLPRGL